MLEAPAKGGLCMNERNYKGIVSVRKIFDDGRTMIVPCTFTVLSHEDIGEIVRLQHEVASGLSPEIFVRTEESEISKFLGDEGITIGVAYEGRLICARTVKTAKQWVDKSISELGYFPTNDKKMAITDFCIVDPEFRGNNMQFLTQYYAECILTQTHDTIVTTVSPKNSWSLTNVLACGYCIVGIKDAYGGYLRYVLEKEFHPDYCIKANEHVSIRYKDMKKQKEAIDEGMIGYKIVQHPRGREVLFAFTEETE